MEFDSVDDWFSGNSFASPSSKGAKGVSTKRDKARSSGSHAPSRRSGQGARWRSVRSANQTSVQKKSPEVMVKITGSSKGLATARNHLDYISRNGDVELVTEQGESLKGNRAVRNYKELLRMEQIPEESNKREFLHVVFSMPKDTEVKGLKEAVSNFCKEEFGNRRYVMAFHDDTDHRHVHVCVGTRDIDRADEPRLSPRKGDLRNWREDFAAQLRDVGVEAAASPRSVRFNHKKGRNFVVAKIDKSGVNPEGARVRPESKVTSQTNQYIEQALRSGERPINPLKDEIDVRRAKVIRLWEEALSGEVAAGNEKGAAEVQRMISDGAKPPSTRLQDDFDSRFNARKEQEKKQIGTFDDFGIS